MSGRPQYNLLGFNDKSELPKVVAKPAVGQHAVKAFLIAQKGAYGPKIVNAAKAQLTLGSETFNIKGEFVNHQTIFAAKALSKATCIIERIDMGGKTAGLTHFIDIATKTKTLKKRTSTGVELASADTLATDEECYVIRHVYGNVEATTQEGTMENADGSKSTMYPIFSVSTLAGSFYNGLGYSVEPRENSTKADVVARGQFIYSAYALSKVDGITTKAKTAFGGANAKLSLVEDANGENFGKSFADAFYGENVTGDLNITTYDENIKTVAGMIATKEQAFLTANAGMQDKDSNVVNLDNWFDNADTLNETPLLVNLFGLASTSGVKYFTASIEALATTDKAGLKIANAASPFFMQGGTDYASTLDTAAKRVAHYEAAIRVIMAGYLDKQSPLMETAVNPETVIYDSGFIEMDTKYALTNIIAVRKDTAVVLSTAKDGITQTAEEEATTGKLLKARLELNPDSTYYATGVARGVICFDSANIKDSAYKAKVPSTYDLLDKSVSYMGGKAWKEGKSFDAGDESTVSTLYNFTHKFVPPALKDALWSTGINWVEPYLTEDVFHWPAFATVSDDTSSLNSIFTMYCGLWAQRVHINTWKVFTGETRYPTRETFAEAVELDMLSAFKDKFDGRFAPQPKVSFTADSLAKGYQWDSDVLIKTGGMYTVVRATVTVARND